mmetsp:Transcript_50672/g.146113  ORF Transcript_50672/g.146113 Transcript_50672/m.146113 type:complete len:384 (+) Transcript_50672:220-1371(+)
MRPLRIQDTSIAMPPIRATNEVIESVDACGNIVATLPCVGVLERVVSDDGRIGARRDVELVPARAVGVLIVEQAEVRHVPGERRIKTLHREEVLAAFQTKAPAAMVAAIDHDFHRQGRQNLDRPHEVEFEVYIVQIHGRVRRRSQGYEMHPQTIGDKHRIRVNLYRPIVLLVCAQLLHICPDAQEDSGVDNGLPISHRRLGSLKHVRCIALENPHLLPLHEAQQLLFLARRTSTVRRDDDEAVQRRAGWAGGWAERAHTDVATEGPACPRIRVVGLLSDVLATGPAPCEACVLLVALEADTPATRGRHAILRLPRAERWLRVGQRLATPGAVALACHPVVPTSLAASRPRRVLAEAAGARAAAATGRQALLAILGALPRRLAW